MTDPLRNKLSNWETPPPSGAWENISREVSEYRAEKSLSERLLAAENAIPADSWQAIAQSLSTGTTILQQTPVFRPPIPIRPLYPYLIRYGAAAIVIGFLAWVLVDNPFREPESITTSIIPAQNTVTEKPLAASPETPSNSQDDIPSGKVPLALNSVGSGLSEKRNFLKREPKHAVVRPRYAVNVQTPRSQVLPKKAPASGIQSLPVQNRDPRYILVADQNGSPVKLSAKFAPLYYHLSNPGSSNPTGTPPAIMDKLEQMILRSQYIPEPTNLFDLLRLRDILQQEK
ncbi:hypothetical protein ACFSQD_07010 [Flavihumibacter stibioxidans]|uniref:Anti sigma-E protein RseA N-terminal domain-containing protein n=1 Tax=Flavihumibacter stibioxidans TaxID=1834163 RepID=A0ABR7M4X9_9BACT|nr:hypothetical protein [Flavihumibacter stibioxidans]MBC6490063.1 hypothetical protein [Flavihumibacter stibioxidans]